MIYNVDFTAPQIELSNGTMAMFWFSDKEVSASSTEQAEEKVEKMIKNINWKTADYFYTKLNLDRIFDFNGLFCEIMDKDCCPLSNADDEILLNMIRDIDVRPEIDQILKEQCQL